MYQKKITFSRNDLNSKWLIKYLFKGHGCFLKIWFDFRDGNLKRNAVKSEWKAKQQEAFFKSLKVHSEWFVRLLCPQLILLTSAVKHNKFAIYFSCHHRNCLKAVPRDHRNYFSSDLSPCQSLVNIKAGAGLALFRVHWPPSPPPQSIALSVKYWLKFIEFDWR